MEKAMVVKVVEEYYAGMKKAYLATEPVAYWGLLFLLPLSLLPFQENPFLPIKVGILALVLLFALLLSIRKIRKGTVLQQPPQLLLITVSALAFLIALSTIFSINPIKSVFGAYDRYQGGLTWMLYLACLFLGGLLGRKGAEEEISKPLAFATIISGTYGVIQALGGDFIPKAASDGLFGLLRASATFETASFFGAFLTLALPVLTAAYFAKRRPFYAAAIMTGGLALISTFSRGALLGVLFGALLAWLTPTKQKSRKIVIGGAGLLAFVLLLYVTAFHFDRSSTVTGRLALWKMTAPAIASKPLLGYGPDTALDRLPSYMTAEFERFSNANSKAADRSFLPDRAHTFLIDVPSDLGLPFLLILLGLVGTFIFKARNEVFTKRGLNHEVLGLVAAISGYLFALLFHFFSPDAAPIFFLLLGRGVALTEERKVSKSKLIPVISLSILTVVAAIAVAVSWLSIISSYEIRNALEAYKQQDSDGIQAGFHQARAFSPWDSEIDLIEGRTWFLLSKDTRTAASLPAATTALQRACDRSPRDERPLMWLANDRILEYELTGGKNQKLLDEAETSYRKVLAMDPNYSALHLQLGIAAFYKNDTKGAIKEWQKAYTLAPQSTAALKNLEVGYEKLGETEEAKIVKKKIDTLDAPSSGGGEPRI